MERLTGPGRPYPPIDLEAIEARIQAGEQIGLIADEIGVPRSTLYSRRNLAGYPPIRRSYTRKDVDLGMVERRRQAGESLAEIAKELGLSLGTLSAKRSAAGYERVYRGPRPGKAHNWKNGIVVDHRGYRKIRTPGHPAASKQGNYVYEHRLVMEAHLGRFLTSEERVHHVNGDKLDNRLENLALFSSQSEHMRHHYGPGSKFTHMMPIGAKRACAKFAAVR